MTYVIISDIHGNLEALEAVRQEIKRIAPDKVFCLGDVVGYGASPQECIDVTRELTAVTVAGNHDFGVVGLTDITYFNLYAREAISWTAGVLTGDGLDYLRGLPLSHVEGCDVRLVHATPEHPEQWNYIFTHQQALEQFESFKERMCFFGHSHQPSIFEMMDAETIISNSSSVRMREGRRYLINVGSVGQPRDGDPRACLCVYDTAHDQMAIKRVAYDIEGAKAKIHEAGLPPVLASRLSWGE